MDIFEALKTRRSIRTFTDEPISDEDINELLKCAMLAPSAKNQQPWHFMVIRDAGTRQILSQTTPYTKMAADAPVIIVVCGDPTGLEAGAFWAQDCAAATENLLLAARGKNIGAVWCGIFPIGEREEKLRQTLQIPQNVHPLGMVCLGHTNQKFFEASRFKPERIHIGKW